MDLFEYQAKELFAEYGVPVQAGKVARTAAEAREAAAEFAAQGHPLVVVMERFCRLIKPSLHARGDPGDHIMAIITLTQAARAEHALQSREELIIIHAATLSARRRLRDRRHDANHQRRRRNDEDLNRSHHGSLHHVLPSTQCWTHC